MLLLLALAVGALGLILLSSRRPDERRPLRLTVVVQHPGTTAEEVEALVARPLEDVVMHMPGSGLRRVQTEALPGRATLRVELDPAPGEDRERLARARTALAEALRQAQVELPDDAELTLGADAAPPVLLVALSAEGLTILELSALNAQSLQPVLQGTPGVLSVETRGEARRQVEVELDPERLKAFGLTVDEVRTMLQRAALEVELPGGVVAAEDGEFLVRASPKAHDLAALGQTVVYRGPDGAPLRLQDVATLREAAVASERVRVSDRPALLNVVRGSDATPPTTLRSDLQQTLSHVRAELPTGVALTTLVEPIHLRVTRGGDGSAEGWTAVAQALRGAVPDAPAVLIRTSGSGPLPPEALRSSNLPPDAVPAILSAAEPALEVLVDARPAQDRVDALLRALETLPETRARVLSPALEWKVRVLGDDLQVLQTAARSLLDRAQADPDVAAGGLEGVATTPTLAVRLDPDRARVLGVNTVDAAIAVRQRSRPLTGPSGVELRVGLPRDAARPEDLLDVQVSSTSGELIPLSLIATVERRQELRRILREDGRRRVDVWLRLRPSADAPRVTARLRKALADLPLPPGVELRLP